MGKNEIVAQKRWTEGMGTEARTYLFPSNLEYLSGLYTYYTVQKKSELQSCIDTSNIVY